MNGRLEHQLEIERKVERKIKDYPDYVTGYYYSLSSKGSYKTKEIYIYSVLAMLEYMKKHGLDISDSSTFALDNVGKFFSDYRYVTENGETRPRSFASRKIMWSALNDFFRYMEGTERVQKNPCNYIDRPKGDDHVKRAHLETRDIKKVIEKIAENFDEDVSFSKQWQAHRDMSMIMLMLSTGVRLAAMTELNTEDIKFVELDSGENGAEIHIVDKENKEFFRLVPSDVAEELKTWLMFRSEVMDGVDDDALFISNRRKRLSLRQAWAMISGVSPEIDGVQISPHKYRATYGTMLYKATHDIYYVQKQMGHAKPSTTELYVTDNNTDATRTTAIIGDVLRKATRNV